MLDLTGVQQVVEEWMGASTVRVSRDVAQDAVLDEVTGDLTEVGPAVLYEGPGLILPAASTPPGVVDPDAARVAEVSAGDYRLLLPVAAVLEVRADDLAVALTSTGPIPDPLLTSRRFEVTGAALVSSYSVVRIVPLKEV